MEPLFNESLCIMKYFWNHTIFIQKCFYLSKKCLFNELILCYFPIENLKTIVLLHIYKVHTRQSDLFK